MIRIFVALFVDGTPTPEPRSFDLQVITVSAECDSRSNKFWTKPIKRNPLSRFAICLKNKGSEDLVVRKVYQTLPDEKAEKKGFLRVIDESGEDYLYPASYFFVLDLPQKIERTLRQRVAGGT